MGNFVSYDNAEDLMEAVGGKFQDVWEANSVLGAKNILPYSYIDTTVTRNGITFTDNGDGTITVDGTATNNTFFIFWQGYLSDFYTQFPNKDLILSGCPKNSNGWRLDIVQGSLKNKNDYGNGVVIPKDYFENSTTIIQIRIRIGNGTTISSPITFYPMIRLAEDTDSEYQPYAMTNKELTDKKDDKPTLVTWEQWNAMTPAQRAAIPKAQITDVPGADGTIRADLFKELWRNPSPSSAFAAQNITLASDDYDFLLWVFKEGLSYDRNNSIISEKGYGINISTDSFSSGEIFVANRRVDYATDTSYSFGDASYKIGTNATVTDNNYLTPIAVYGIKKTLNLKFSAIAGELSTAADHCMMSDGETSVEEAISIKNELDIDNAIDITSAMASNNGTYTFPSNGKVYVSVDYYGSSDSSSDIYYYITSSKLGNIFIFRRPRAYQGLCHNFDAIKGDTITSAYSDQSNNIRVLSIKFYPYKL